MKYSVQVFDKVSGEERWVDTEAPSIEAAKRLVADPALRVGFAIAASTPRSNRTLATIIAIVVVALGLVATFYFGLNRDGLSSLSSIQWPKRPIVKHSGDIKITYEKFDKYTTVYAYIEDKDIGFSYSLMAQYDGKVPTGRDVEVRMEFSCHYPGVEMGILADGNVFHYPIEIGRIVTERSVYYTHGITFSAIDAIKIFSANSLEMRPSTDAIKIPLHMKIVALDFLSRLDPNQVTN